jgi:hypothetical protein
MKTLSAVAGLFLVFLVTACAPAASQAPVSGSEYTLSPAEVEFVLGVDNPYFPLTPGSKWVYEAHLADGGVEHIEVVVQEETRMVNGVKATVVRDTVTIDGEMHEDTIDWYAQDSEGNVWYLGEEVDNYENGEIVNHAGSWEWGKDGALPGIVMWADPSAHIDEEYYQEYFVGEAEDKGQVLSATESVEVPFGSFEDVVQTFDFSSLDPDIQSHKFYAAGVGTIKEIELGTGEELVLIEYTPGG